MLSSITTKKSEPNPKTKAVAPTPSKTLSKNRQNTSKSSLQSSIHSQLTKVQDQPQQEQEKPLAKNALAEKIASAELLLADYPPNYFNPCKLCSSPHCQLREHCIVIGVFRLLGWILLAIIFGVKFSDGFREKVPSNNQKDDPKSVIELRTLKEVHLYSCTTIIVISLLASCILIYAALMKKKWFCLAYIILSSLCVLVHTGMIYVKVRSNQLDPSEKIHLRFLAGHVVFIVLELFFGLCVLALFLVYWRLVPKKPIIFDSVNQKVIDAKFLNPKNIHDQKMDNDDHDPDKDDDDEGPHHHRHKDEDDKADDKNREPNVMTTNSNHRRSMLLGGPRTSLNNDEKGHHDSSLVTAEKGKTDDTDGKVKEKNMKNPDTSSDRRRSRQKMDTGRSKKSSHKMGRTRSKSHRSGSRHHHHHHHGQSSSRRHKSSHRHRHHH